MTVKPTITLIAAALVLAAPVSAADDPRQGEQWGLAMIEAPGAWSTSTGVGALVAVIDTGADLDHPDLEGRLEPGFDYVGDDPEERGDEDDDPEDGEGHGTHVSGIVAANAGNGEGVAGVAPGAKVIPYRVLDNRGEGYADDATNAINRAVDDGADVINLSLGDTLPFYSDVFSDPAFENALKRAVAADIIVVLAAGNSSLPTCENPDIEGVLCVGSVDSRGVRSFFSSFGPEVHVMGPGGSAAGGSDEDILSTIRRGRYGTMAGTSQAAPHVSGVAALLVSLGVRGGDAVNRILETAKDAGPPGADNQYGAGIVNAKAAVGGMETPKPGPDTRRGSFSVPDSIKVKTVLKRGIRVTCRAVRPGRCSVSVFRKGRKIAGGAGDVPADSPTPVVARLNKYGRKVVKRIKRAYRVGVRVTLPGDPVQGKTISIKR